MDCGYSAGMERPKTRVLFLCTGNSCRSQMAEALLRHLAGARFEALSAGTEPKEIHPLTLAALDEIGVPTAGLRSKNLREYLGTMQFAYVVSVCAAADQSCPTIWPGVMHRVAAPFDDPAALVGSPAEQLVEFRRVRDAIKAWLEDWIETVSPVEQTA